jgi:hypothetical protein
MTLLLCDGSRVFPCNPKEKLYGLYKKDTVEVDQGQYVLEKVLSSDQGDCLGGKGDAVRTPSSLFLELIRTTCRDPQLMDDLRRSEMEHK